MFCPICGKEYVMQHQGYSRTPTFYTDDFECSNCEEKFRFLTSEKED